MLQICRFERATIGKFCHFPSFPGRRKRVCTMTATLTEDLNCQGRGWPSPTAPVKGA